MLLIVVCVSVAVVLTRGEAAASEVFLTPQDQPGADPFTSTVASAPPPQATVPSTPKVAGAELKGAIRSLPAEAPGLYGGTQQVSYCDPEKMVAFLEQNPDKARAWAGVLGIQVSQIRAYVKTLTPVLLRSDTRVTNHGYANGQATVINAVLQAGTAVLVDHYGVPRVKCNCGNPLTPPTALSAPRYTGPQWVGYSVTNIVVVQQSVTIIDNYVLYDPVAQATFERPAGSTGTDDRPTGSSAATSTSTATSEPPTTPTAVTTEPPIVSSTTRPPTTPTPPTTQLTTTTSTGPPPPASASEVVAIFTQRRAACLQDPNLNWPFKSSPTADVYTATPTTDPYVWLFTAVNHPPGETQTWTWTYDGREGRFAATNGLASQANAGCRSLELGR